MEKPEVKITIEAGEQKSVQDNEEKNGRGKKSYAKKHKRTSEKERKEMLELFHRGDTPKDIAFLEDRQIKSIRKFIDGEVRNHFLLDEREWEKLNALFQLCWTITKVDQSMTLREFFDSDNTSCSELKIDEAPDHWPNFIRNKRMMRDWIEYFQLKFDCQEALKNNPNYLPTENCPDEKPNPEKMEEIENSELMKIKYHNLLKMENIFELGIPKSVDVMRAKGREATEFYNKNIKKD